MKFLAAVLLVFIFSSPLFAQKDLVPLRLNEKIGYMIDKQENKDYGFFTECPADSFLYAKIYADSLTGEKQARVYFKNGSLHNYPITAARLEQLLAKAAETVVHPKEPYQMTGQEGELIVGLGRLIITAICHSDKN